MVIIVRLTIAHYIDPIFAIPTIPSTARLVSVGGRHSKPTIEVAEVPIRWIGWVIGPGTSVGKVDLGPIDWYTFIATILIMKIVADIERFANHYIQVIGTELNFWSWDGDRCRRRRHWRVCLRCRRHRGVCLRRCRRWRQWRVRIRRRRHRRVRVRRRRRWDGRGSRVDSGQTEGINLGPVDTIGEHRHPHLGCRRGRGT